MISADRQRKLARFGMCTNGLGDGFGDTRYESGTLHDALRRVAIDMYVFELMVPIELDVPADFFELPSETGFDQVDRTKIDTCARLSATKRTSYNLYT